MRFKLAFQLAAVALVGAAVSVMAQQPGQPGQGRGRGGPPGGGGGGFSFIRSRISLLGITEVKKELELADEQVQEIEKINEELRAKYPFGGRGGGGPPGGDQQRGRRGGNNNDNEGASLAVPASWYFVAQQEPNQQQPGQGRGRGGGPQLTPEQQAEIEKQRLERTREEKAKLAEILLPNQLKRLTEIFIQTNGAGALQDEEIAKELGISDTQKAKLAEVRDANAAATGALMREMFQGGGGGGDRDANRAKMEELRKAGDAKLLAVLSADQQKKFEEMKGKPFAMPEGAGRGGPGGTGGGGNRGRGGTKSGNNNN